MACSSANIASIDGHRSSGDLAKPRTSTRCSRLGTFAVVGRFGSASHTASISARTLDEWNGRWP